MNDISVLETEARQQIAAADSIGSLEALKTAVLGRKGRLTEVLRGLSQLPIEERRLTGEKANRLRAELETLIEARHAELREKEIAVQLSGQKAETSPAFAFPFPSGHIHPLRQTINEISGIFRELGFEIAAGPEIETDWYNFEALNIPADHPARDTQDTFYLADGKHLLRTHTSPMQIHVMEEQRPPVRVIIPGRVYRNEATDATHSATFHQVEGLAVDENITFADLKGTLTLFFRRLFGSRTKLRFRPSYFQFTEPSAEIDVTCIICGGKGCPVCKHTGWIEMMGCGMVHPNVFKAVKYDTERYTGFAFGMGVERLAIIRYGVNDIRLFYENNLQFLSQF